MGYTCVWAGGKCEAIVRGKRVRGKRGRGKRVGHELEFEGG